MKRVILPAALVALTVAGCAVPGQMTTPAVNPTPPPPTTMPAPAPVESVKDRALDSIMDQLSQRASTADLTRDQVRTALDQGLCPNKEDLLGSAAAAHRAVPAVGTDDASYIWGINAVVGYC